MRQLIERGWQPTRRQLNLGQTASWCKPLGRGRLHMRVYPDGNWSMHWDAVDPDRSWLHALAHFFIDMVPWWLKGAAR